MKNKSVKFIEVNLNKYPRGVNNSTACKKKTIKML